MQENETRAPEGGRSWKKIGLITGGVFAVLMLIGIVAGDPEEKTELASNGDTVVDEVTTTTRATTKATTTTEAPTTTLAPSTTTTAPPPTTTTAPPPPPPPPPPAVPVSQSNARRKADDYLDMMAFSRQGLIEQLEFEGFSTGDATYGVDSLGADWNQQAARKAAEYLEMMPFSREGLIDQLVFEGFSRGEAEYGVSTTGL